MAGTTSKGFRYPQNSDAPNVAVDIQNLATDVDTGLDSYIAKSLVTAQGDLITASGSAVPTRLAIGAANTVLSSNGTAVSWIVDPTTDVVTTAGDLIYGTGADAVTRLGIGTAFQVLRVNSGATAPEWGSAYTWREIATGSITGSSTSPLVITGIDAEELLVYCAGWSHDNATARALGLRFNEDSGNNYNSASASAAKVAQITVSATTALTNSVDTSFYVTGCKSGQEIKQVFAIALGGSWVNSDAVTSISLFPLAGSFDAGTYYVYARG